MSLTITINNLDDLTDKERAVLRLIVGDTAATLTGPSVTKQYLESLAGDGSGEALPPIPAPVNVPVFGAYTKTNDVEGSIPLPSAPVAIVPTVPTPASAELDSAGLPWDKRIHASSRNKLQDGTWRMMRGVDKAVVESVEAELRAVQAIPVPVAPVVEVVGDKAVIAVPSPHLDNRREAGDEIAVAAPERYAPVWPFATEQHGVHGGEGATVPLPAVPAPVPAPTATLAEMQAKLDAVAPPVPVPPTPLTFADLMKHVTPMLVAGTLPQDTLLAITAEFGLPHLAALGARPDLVAAVRARIDEVVGGAQ